jgi:PAS domain S-box-containing protein
MLGYGPGELVGRPLTTIIPERLRETHLRSFERLVAGGEPRLFGKLVELAALRRDAGEVPVELMLGMAKHDQETLFTASLRDITERKAAELRMRRLVGAVEAADEARASAH